MHMRPGIRVVCRGNAGKGQVTVVRDGACEVLWPGDRRELHPESDLIWVGLRIHTHDGWAGRVIELGRKGVRVRLPDGCHWMSADQFAPREAKRLEEDVLAQQTIHGGEYA